MKINSINTYNNLNYTPNFKKTAVPYPEYANAYYVVEVPIGQKILSSIDKKISDFFSPKVTKETQKIKSTIDNLYSDSPRKTAEKKLLSVLA